MFDDLVINDGNYEKCKQEPDPNANVKNTGSVQGTTTGKIPTSPPIKKILSNGGYSAGSNQGLVPNTQQSLPPLPTAVVLDFDLAKMFMLDCFLKDSVLEKNYLVKIADMIEFSVNTQGLNVQDKMNRLKMAEMILAEIFY